MNKYLVALLASASLWTGAVLANPIGYTASLTGAAENPAVASPATGTTSVDYDPILHTLFIDVDFAGLLGTTTAAHIHCCTPSPLSNAGVATQVPTFLGFPLGVSSGSYSHLFDLTDAASFNPAFITAHGGTAAGAEAFLAAGLANGEAYLNIHTNQFPGGEIRGNLAQVPEPAALSLLALGFGIMLVGRRRASNTWQ